MNPHESEGPTGRVLKRCGDIRFRLAIGAGPSFLHPIVAEIETVGPLEPQEFVILKRRRVAELQNVQEIGVAVQISLAALIVSIRTSA
jgi:hypothetical protein